MGRESRKKQRKARRAAQAGSPNLDEVRGKLSELEDELASVKESWTQDRRATQDTIKTLGNRNKKLREELARAKQLDNEREDTVHSLLKSLQEMAVKAQYAEETLDRLQEQVTHASTEKARLEVQVRHLEYRNKQLKADAERNRFQTTGRELRQACAELRSAQEQLRFARKRISRLEVELDAARSQSFRRGWSGSPSASPEVSKDDFRLLASLIHPDVHPAERGEKANAAMKLLLTFRS